MFLKKITVSGFKSFADRITLNFNTGITGIVGPNGSGKSNIIDAVRWVMGEQNARNLRGEKATDIIFAGSQKRKPLGMAEVSLIFDNTDDSSFCPPEYRHEQEISLTRRLYADGQREYLINRKACRLKDIVGFFALTGLGGRSYSMIQQGQVDRILNAKPEDVREILEEAAGTLAYKKRKNEAKRKLENTKLNLSRIEDIVQEVDRQLDALQGQVKSAQLFQERSDRLRERELSLFAHHFHILKEKEHTIEMSLSKESAFEAEVMSKRATHETRQEELRNIVDQADPELQAAQESITVIREQIARAESTLQNANTRIDGGSKRLDELAYELTEDDANLKVLERQVDAAQIELDAASETAEAYNEAIESFRNDVEMAEEAARMFEGRIEEYDDEQRNLERLLEANRFKNETIERDLEKTRQHRSTEKHRLNTLEEEMTSTLVVKEEAERNAASKKAGLDVEIREKHERETAVARRYEETRQAGIKRDELKEQYHTVRARVMSLQELETGATDVAGSVAQLFNDAPETTSLVKGLFTDFISFNDNAAELPAMTKASFERWSERLVVKDLDSFNSLVRAAQQNNIGNLPVSTLSLWNDIDTSAVQTWADKFDAEPITAYLNTEKADDEINKILCRLYHLPALEISEDVLSEVPKGVMVFTAKGISFNSGEEFVIAGKGASGLLSRKTELEELERKLKGIETQLAHAQASIDDLEIKTNEDRQIVAEIDQKLQSQNQDVIEVMTELERAQQQTDHKQQLINDSRSTVEQLDSNEKSLLTDAEQLEIATKALSDELEITKNDLASIREESEIHDEKNGEIRRQYEGKRLDLAKSEARTQALRDSYLTTKAQLELLQNKLSRRYEERSRLEADIVNAKVELEQSEKDIAKHIYEREDLEKEYSSRREEHSGILEELRMIEDALKECHTEESKRQKNISDKTVSLERIKVGLEGVIEQAEEKYHLTLDGYEFEREESFNLDNQTRNVQRLRSQIESMGDINMMAVKEYEILEERRSFIERQQNEVISCIDLLVTAITEIEETSKTKFLAIFTRINEEFGKLFPILFPTGEGKLVLTNEEEPLEGGVEIICRLPGKQQKNMNLFSGGEKALTAISLIFAMLRTKPTPFCFLDEVDAALDEANVGRYNRVLEALANQFQFIVITHNRRTIEVLESLYGITMQEPGVSKVVGVDMQKDLPPHLRKALETVGKNLDKYAASETETAVEGATQT